MNNRNLDFDDVKEIVKSFRAKWEKKIAAAAMRKLTLTPKSGKKRTLYLLERDHDILVEFDRAMRKLKKCVATLKTREQTRAYQTLAIPTFVRKCSKVRHKAYQAISVREIEPEQARHFLLRLDKEVPKKRGVYCIRSVTGKRYTLAIRADGKSKERPFPEWAVLEYIGRASVESLPWELEVVKPKLTGAQWAKKHNRKFLGKNGKSRLYLQL